MFLASSMRQTLLLSILYTLQLQWGSLEAAKCRAAPKSVQNVQRCCPLPLPNWGAYNSECGNSGTQPSVSGTKLNPCHGSYPISPSLLVPPGLHLQGGLSSARQRAARQPSASDAGTLLQQSGHYRCLRGQLCQLRATGAAEICRAGAD